MSNGKNGREGPRQVLDRLPEIMQLGTRVYHVLLNGIVSGRFEPGAPLRPDAIARQLEVSTTPVREAMHRLEGDGLAIKLPYQGWFVCEHSRQQIRSTATPTVTRTASTLALIPNQCTRLFIRIA